MKKIAILLGTLLGLTIIGTALAQTRPRRPLAPQGTIQRFETRIYMPGTNRVTNQFSGTLTPTAAPVAGQRGTVATLNAAITAPVWSKSASTTYGMYLQGNLEFLVFDSGGGNTVTCSAVNYSCIDVRGNLRSESLGAIAEVTGLRGNIACAELVSASATGCLGGSSDAIDIRPGSKIYVPGLTKASDILSVCKEMYLNSSSATQAAPLYCMASQVPAAAVTPSESLLDLSNAEVRNRLVTFFNKDKICITYRASSLP